MLGLECDRVLGKACKGNKTLTAENEMAGDSVLQAAIACSNIVMFLCVVDVVILMTTSREEDRGTGQRG